MRVYTAIIIAAALIQFFIMTILNPLVVSLSHFQWLLWELSRYNILIFNELALANVIEQDDGKRVGTYIAPVGKENINND